MKTILVACATVAMLVTGTASANHCDSELAEAELAIDTLDTFEPNRLDAAEALVARALEICAFEEQELLTEGFDSPLSDPEYVSMGQSMLINARELASGQ